MSIHPDIHTILTGLTHARFESVELEGSINNALKNISADLLSVKFEFDPRTKKAIEGIISVLQDIRLEARAKVMEESDESDTNEDEDTDDDFTSRYTEDDDEG